MRLNLKDMKLTPNPGNKFEGSNWNEWSTSFKGLLMMANLGGLLELKEMPSHATQEDWDTAQGVMKGYFMSHMAYTIWSSIESDATYPTVAHKWGKLRETYAGVGATTAFNNWVSLTQARLDDSKPMTPQLNELNALRNNLTSAGMGVSDL